MRARKQITLKTLISKDKSSKRLSGYLSSATALFLCFAICYPITFLIFGSYMDDLELFTRFGMMFGEISGFSSVPAFPSYPSADQYVSVLIDNPEFHALMRNSAIYTGGVLAGQLIVGVPAAWGFARYDFKGNEALFFMYIVLMILPFQVLMLPNYLVLDYLGLVDTPMAIVLPGVFSAFPVFIMRHFFREIPRSIIESARLDGANDLSVFFRIGIPLGSPGIFAALVLSFFEYWNLVEQPIAYLHDKTSWPVSLFLGTATAENIGVLLASAVISSIPSILIFLIGSDSLQRGIAAMSTKG